MTDEELTLAIAELQEVVRCRCDEAYRDRGLKDPHCECDSAEAVKVVASRIKALKAKLAKAVEALEVIRDRQYYRMGPGVTAQVIARATLAEIKGESHD